MSCHTGRALSKVILPLAMLVVVLIGWTVTLPAGVSEQRRYHIRHGREEYVCQWELRQDEAITITTRQKTEECVTTLNQSRESARLEVKDVRTRLAAERTGDVLTLSGTLGGRPIRERYELDAQPWHQVMSYALQEFARADAKEMEFWMLHPTNFVPYKMKAAKEGSESVMIAGQVFSAQRVRLKIKGIPALLWHGDAWCRSGDGLLLRYKGPNGPPGSSATVIEYLTESS